MPPPTGRGKHMDIALNLIKGSWREVHGDFVDDVFDPATGEVIAKLPYSQPGDVDEAIMASALALNDWSHLPSDERLEVLRRLRSLVKDQTAELASLIVRENGKTIGEAEDELAQALKVIDFACEGGAGLADAAAEGASGDQSVRTPAGVCAGISYYNFPLVSVLWMVAPALACGNTFVLRPCTYSPLTGTRVAALLGDAGLPAGVLNVVHGAIEVVDQILADDRVTALSYVGSGPWAHYMYRVGAAAGKRIQALGAIRSAIIVMEDADLDSAVQAIRSSAYAMAGQRWLGGTIALPVGSIGEPLVRALIDAAQRLDVGPGSDPATSMGPIIRADRRQNAVNLIGRAASNGTTVPLDGRAMSEDDGYFLGPTIIDKVSANHELLDEEFFGPICAVCRVLDLGEAVRIVNAQGRHGVASIFTGSADSARTFTEEANAARVGVNWIPRPIDFMPQASVPSYYGDLSMSGDDIFRFYTRRKAITSQRT